MSNRSASRKTTEAALKAHRAGKGAEARRLYLAALAQDAGDAQALHGLGVLAFEAGERDQALALLGKAARQAPKIAEFRRNYANALAASRQFEPAILEYEAVLKLEPRSAADWSRLGTALSSLGRHEAAAKAFETALSHTAARSPERIGALRRLGQAQWKSGDGEAALQSWRAALSLDPRQPDVAFNLGELLKQLGRVTEAEAAYRQALAIKPEDGAVLTNLGALLRETDRYEEAEAVYRAALRAEPASVMARRNLAVALHDREKDAEALTEIEAVLAAAPQDTHALQIAAAVLQALGRHEEALAMAARLLALDPKEARVPGVRARSLLALDRTAEALAAARDAMRNADPSPDALADAAFVLRTMGELDEAIACYRALLAIRPGDVDAHVNLGGSLLSTGDFTEGWVEYEWRWKRKQEADRRNRPLPQPLWDGTKPLAGRLLVWNEQGVGDEVMFSSLLPEMATNLDCVLECDPRLVPLLRRSLPKVEVVARLQPLPDPRLSAPDIARQAPAGTVARWLRPDLASFAGKGGAYLVPDAARVAGLKRSYQGARLRVGIAWHTRADQAQGRCIELQQFEPLLLTPGIRFFSVQYGDHGAEIGALKARCGVEIFADPSIDQMKDLDGFAAQLAALDLVITIDNSAAHFAGALGVPCWVLLPYLPEWRWQLGRSDSIWWPSLRLYRQSRRGDWSEPLARLSAALVRLLQEQP
jgi:tetratricopeptide (TPR) repeat protein